MVHQAAATAAIGGVIQQRDSCLLQQCDRVALMRFFRGGDAIAIGIRQSVEPLPAVALLLWQMAQLLLAPGGAVTVFQHDLDANTALLSADQRLGNPRQGEFLHCQLHALLGSINGSNQKLFQVVAVAPLSRQR